MRSYSFFTILLLCLGILIIDILAFYWLQSITNLITSEFVKKGINIIFWLFTIGLVSAILILKIRLDDIPASKKNGWVTSLYGLTVSSFAPKLIFVLVISILYFGNHLLSERESLIAIPLIGLFSGVLPFFIILFGIFGTRYHYKVEKLSIEIPDLPQSFVGTRLIQISDIHLGSFDYSYHQLTPAIALINKLKPDYILFTGDLVNNYSWELAGWEEVFNKLVAKKGKYAILGNHDYGNYSEWPSKEEKLKNFEKIKSFFRDIDFKLLLNESVTINNPDGSLAFIGVENWGHPPFPQYGNLKKAMMSLNGETIKILLSHDPTHWSEEVIRKTDIALTLSGHTHGMQMGINLKKVQWSPIKYKYEHWAGLYQNNTQFLYVNRGLGWLGFPGRVGMRPEITCIDLK